LLALRIAVFVVEQSCPYQEADGLDHAAVHLLGEHESEIMACLRLLPPGAENTSVQIGRVAVVGDARGSGLARKMMEKALNRAAEQYPGHAVFVSAQTYLCDFYQSLGFEVSGDGYLEDGIPHLPMTLTR
jgi:ElaA protein